MLEQCSWSTGVHIEQTRRHCHAPHYIPTHTHADAQAHYIPQPSSFLLRPHIRGTVVRFIRSADAKQAAHTAPSASQPPHTKTHTVEHARHNRHNPYANSSGIISSTRLRLLVATQHHRILRHQLRNFPRAIVSAAASCACVLCFRLALVSAAPHFPPVAAVRSVSI